MAKVFRLFKDSDLQHWESRGEAYGPGVIELIPNPDGDLSKREPTSIPSPFARIDLARTALEYVVNKNQLEGNTIYHKLISDCFDVGEMFFKIDSLGGKAQIKYWDKNINLNTLKESANPKHKLYGETLDLFLKQDETYNFESLNRMFFLFYDFQIIGGTSPSTLFFTSANDLKDVCKNINFGNYSPFDGKNTPLLKRDPEYQKYLYHFFYANPSLKSKMIEFYKYLGKNLAMLFDTNNDLHNEIKQLENKSADVLNQELDAIYEAIDTGTAGDNLEIIGCWMKKKKIKDRGKVIEEFSDFVIKSSKYTGGHKPLVLQNSFAQRLNYTDKSVHWNSTTVVPYFDKETDINNRTLPGQLDKYPYLTVSDFLQGQIIRVQYKINSDKYFDGNITYKSGDESKSFLLPLSKKFFEYFDTEDLQKHMYDGKSMFEATVFAGSIDVTLRIPIKGNGQGNYITFERSYSSAKSDTKDIINNKGIIIDNKMSLAVYPFVKLEENAFYRIMALDQGTDPINKHNSLSLNFYSNKANQAIEIKKTSRTEKKNGIIQSDFYSLENPFDYIEAGYEDNLGIIIPILKPNSGSKKMRFAVDFGTTNTHIEYKFADDVTSLPFTISEKDIQYETLHNYNNETDIVEIDTFIRHEFLPKIIGDEFKFPIRTVSGESKSLDFSKKPMALADLNIPFDYEKYVSNIDTEITTDLKWSDFEEADSPSQIRVEKFIENILLLIRSKVLFNNGDLNKTEIIWFYPSSMATNKIHQLESIWNKFFNIYFKKGKTVKLSESIAPYYYYQNKGNIIAATDTVVSIDIGGGTTDIVVFQQENPIALTSARFAANSIFGDGYGGGPLNNGFVIGYKDRIEGLLTNNNLDKTLSTFDQILKKSKSEDLVAFFFSLEKNKTIIDSGAAIDFSSWLSKDKDLKIVFVVFYASIIYHIANLMKAEGIDAPKNILFSGTGSKSILITSGSDNLDNLNKLTGLIFDKVYKTKKKHKIAINIEANPKEITCKGGLEIDLDNIPDLVDVNVLIGTDDKRTTKVNPIKYDAINEEIKKSVVIEVNDFVDILFSIDSDLNFSNNFGVNSAHFDLCKTILKEDTLNLLAAGINRKTKSLDGNFNTKIEESLFFYPLVGALNKLSYEIKKAAKK